MSREFSAAYFFIVSLSSSFAHICAHCSLWLYIVSKAKMKKKNIQRFFKRTIVVVFLRFLLIVLPSTNLTHAYTFYTLILLQYYNISGLKAFFRLDCILNVVISLFLLFGQSVLFFSSSYASTFNSHFG